MSNVSKSNRLKARLPRGLSDRGPAEIAATRAIHERQREALFPTVREYTARYGLTEARAERLKPDALIMHPGPMNRGVEIASTIADHSRSVIRDQVEMGVAVRMAVLEAMARQLPNR